MNELPYKVEHLEEYTGILTSDDARSEKFKMELKVEDNPVLERSVEKIEASIELEFHYNMGTSTLFFHNIISCPKSRRDEECSECKKIMAIYDKFVANLYYLQVGDTFKIKAALIHNKKSELPVRVQSFKDYERIEVACTEYRVRLPDTPEGIQKKVELEEQRLQLEEKKEANQKKADRKAKWNNTWTTLENRLMKHPNINKIIVTALITTIANQIPNIVKFVKYISRLFVSN